MAFIFANVVSSLQVETCLDVCYPMKDQAFITQRIAVKYSVVLSIIIRAATKNQPEVGGQSRCVKSSIDSYDMIMELSKLLRVREEMWNCDEKHGNCRNTQMPGVG